MQPCRQHQQQPSQGTCSPGPADSRRCAPCLIMRANCWQNCLHRTSGPYQRRGDRVTPWHSSKTWPCHLAGGSCAGSTCGRSQPGCAASRPKGLPDSAGSSNSNIWPLPAAETIACTHLLPCQRARHATACRWSIQGGLGRCAAEHQLQAPAAWSGLWRDTRTSAARSGGSRQATESRAGHLPVSSGASVQAMSTPARSSASGAAKTPNEWSSQMADQCSVCQMRP